MELNKFLLTCTAILFVLPLIAVSDLIIPRKDDFIRLPNAATQHVGRYTNVRISSDGFAIISFNDEINGGIRVVKRSGGEAGKIISSVVVDAHPGQANNGRFIRMEINPKNQRPYFAYISSGKKATMLAFCQDKACQKTQIKELCAGPATHPSLAFRPVSGFPIVAYARQTDKKMFLTMCNDLSCSSFKTIPITRAQKPIVGDYIHAEVSPDNIPVFSWMSAGSQQLKYARCVDEACSDFKHRILDSSKNVGRYNFMRLDRHGNAIIMYTDVHNGYLKTAYCGDALCSRPVISIIDDSIGAKELVRGVFPEVAINPYNGLPVLSYVAQPNDIYKNPQGTLKIAQCQKSDCSKVLIQEIARGGFAYGRDSSIAFKDNLVYLSFLDYNGNKKLAYLVVLKQQK